MDGLVAVPYRNCYGAARRSVAGKPDPLCWRSDSIRSASGAPSCVLVADLALQRLGGQQDEFFGVEG